MENLGDILKRLGTTNGSSDGHPPEHGPPEHAINDGDEPSESCDVCRGRGWFTADVPAGDPEFGRIITCGCQLTRLEGEKSTRLLRYSNLSHMTRFTFDSLDPKGLGDDAENRRLFAEACAAAVEYAEDPQGWLVFAGANGSGKTHLAAAVAHRRIERGQVVLFVHVPDLLDHLRATFAPSSEESYSDLFDQVRNTPMLVLDGMESQATTPWAQEKLQQILNHRYNAELPTIITTATDIADMDPYIRGRILTHTLSRVFELRAPDHRPMHSLGRVDPEMLRRMTFDTFDLRGNNPTADQKTSLEAAFQASKNFAADSHGWLTLIGETGVGKTHLAIAIAVERMKGNHPVFYAFVPELLDHLRYTFTPESRVTYDRLFDEVKNAPLLILDDLGQEQTSPWAVEKLYQIIVHRHNARLPTVITSTMDFAQTPGPRSSRIRDPYVGQLIRVDTPDYRSRAKEQIGRKDRDAGARKRTRASE